MRKMTANEIRDSWIKFFEAKQHQFIPPASLIPINDPSLLWINSGVATLKNYFSGKENPPSKRLVNSQKALRTSDFFNVGVTSRHHTLFEMLGNFSIGDYFKKEAVDFAYELLIDNWQIDPNKLWITIYEDDEQTYQLWLNHGIPSNRIIKCARDRNFWDVGNGPCGPCTEIHYDRGEKYDPNHIGEKLILQDIENDRYVEIWNIVFSQFNNDGNNKYTELLRKNIDTGAGLERLACISQDVPTNFDTDLFQTIIKKIQQYSEYKYDMNAYFTNDPHQTKVNFAYKVIADHFRATVLAISDGAIPDNKDRGYVLRRLIRRAVVYSHNLQITDSQWISSAVDGVIDSLQPFYSELVTNRNQIINVINKEAELFNFTLKQGMKIFNNAVEANELNNDVIFNLVTTYGFPIEIIKEMAQNKNITIDENEFQKRFAVHQKISNASQNIKALDNQNNALINLDLPSKFIYDKFEIDSKIIALYDDDFNAVQQLNGDGYVVVEETVFYATSGGQINDTGKINDQYLVDNVIKAPNFQHVHHVIGANLKLNDIINLKINISDRRKNMAHHSAEHLLQSALKAVVTNDIKQQGAFKSPQKMTFDFQYPEKLTDATLQQVEDWVNEAIAQNIDVEVLMMTLEEAKTKNVTAYFEDKYKKISGLLRVINIKDKSIEFCGGTHVHNTKEIEKFAITNFITKGSGQWRIEGVATFDNIKKYQEDFLASVNEFYLQNKNSFVSKNIATDALDEMFNEYNNKITQAKLRHYNNLFNEFKAKVNELKTTLANDINKKEIINIKNKYQSIDSAKKVIVINGEYSMNIVNKAIDELIKENKTTVYCALIAQDNKLNYLVAINKNSNLEIGQYLLKINEISGGKGFAKTNFCIGGGGNPDKLDSIMNYLTEAGFKNA